MGYLIEYLALLKSEQDTYELRVRIYLFAFGVVLCQVVYITGMNP